MLPVMALDAVQNSSPSISCSLIMAWCVWCLCWCFPVGQVDQYLLPFFNQPCHNGWNGWVEMTEPFQERPKWVTTNVELLVIPRNWCRFPCYSLYFFVFSFPTVLTVQLNPFISCLYLSLHFCPVLLSLTLSFPYPSLWGNIHRTCQR